MGLDDVMLMFDDVLIKILSKLPVKSLLRFRCVSKRWLYLISEDPLLIQLHSHQSNSKPSLVFLSNPTDLLADNNLVISSIDMEGNLISKFEVKIERKCLPILLPTNFDLVCMYNYKKIIHICNPSTHELITLPPLPPFEIYHNPVIVSFGYVESTDEYKVVCLVPTYYHHSTVIKCQVFTLGGSKSSSSSSSSWVWRDVMNCPCMVVTTTAPAFSNGALHWLPSHYLGLDPERPERSIIAFDVESEEFRLIPHPKGFRDLRSFTDEYVRCELIGLRGLLCLSCRNKDSKLDMWMLKDYEGGTWMKEYSIDLNVVINSTRYYGWDYDCYGRDDYTWFTPRDIDDTKVLMEIEYDNEERFMLGYYHLQTTSFEKFTNWETEFFFSLYVQSLRSLKKLQGKASIEAEAKV